MGRTASFEREAVVRAARGVFWREGFESAAVPDLERATGLGRSSLYHAFGSKRGLFDAAVQSYLDEIVRPRLRPLQHEPVPAAALADYLAGLAQAITRADTRDAAHGCLLINAAGSPLAHDPELAKVITAYRAELRDAVDRGIRARRPHDAPAERERTASTVTGLVVGSYALARIAPDEAVRLLHTARSLVV
ncbi:TetR/AcrR family transcriptional regulator [Microbacterium xanthum]|uniref:TetR/AcrR family transcriptional regulator n=1 Tax=Microbacterium xanthum TaxID=3079794 RepID=UPI002AD5A9E5|nr:TetR/AcrR family transcriptional regulator [Microbacterium sp. KSW-48]MDZ8170654.1 TetR/AcrR family transcriptional regulator [Microbacterium sp. KSW-48]